MIHQLTLSDVCRENARRYPTTDAVVDGELRYPWPEFDSRVDRVANLLAAQGVKRGDRILWLAQSSHRFLELMIAAARLGAMICPANWRQSAYEMAFVIEDFDPAVIVWQHEEIGATVIKAREIADSHALWIQHDSKEADGYDALVDATSAEPVVVGEVSADDALLVIYTAAIVDRPGGSLLTHRNLLTMAATNSRVTGSDHTSVFLNSGPLFHIGNFQFEALPVFLMGGTNVFVRRVEAANVLQILADERVTSAFLMPPTIMAIRELNKSAGLDISRLRGGAHAPVWGDALPTDPTLWSQQPGGFGQTEVTGMPILRAFGEPGIGNAGRPSPFTQVKIVDADCHEVADGEVGEIVIRGDTVHLGYWNRPDTNAARFLEGGWWRTTDAGRREKDGTISFLGTLTRMVKSAAENIYPPEVENCLTGHPAVRAAAIIGVPDPAFAQSVKAIVVREPGTSVSEGELRDYCRERIASYKKPKFVEFVDEIPTVDGRTDYDALDATFGGGGYPGRVDISTPVG
ncbi:AMP-binding protein [Gordonia rhizosphera]|uniref:Putative acyl-CoA synthetase n=1 Tax=Gordonia rhizosphera NBRC 16068 TaxID=1108045 RepID=K6WJD5_9ACTN|nr:AMP-binding protein [Gordonia rhizosphera]GAB92272.1 putative acyl-CoA synthetase [Gordonia rhizosphera NBRC 16068]